MYFSCCWNLWLTEVWLVVIQCLGTVVLNGFYTPPQNHMMSDLSVMANCPARKREEGEECVCLCVCVGYRVTALWKEKDREQCRGKQATPCKLTRLFTGQKLNCPFCQTTPQLWPVKHTAGENRRRWNDWDGGVGMWAALLRIHTMWPGERVKK